MKKKSRVRSRTVMLEALEMRQLLSVTPAILELDGTSLTNNQTITWQAGIALHLRAVDTINTTTYDPSGGSTYTSGSNPNNTEFSWDFGDTASLSDPDYTGATPARFSHDALVGFNVAHVYDTPGTYTVKLTTTDQNGVQASLSIHVAVSSTTLGSSHSDVETADSNIIYVDSVNGNDTWTGKAPSRVGTTSDGPFKTFAAAMDYLQTGTPSNVQVRFKRGEKFPVFQADYNGGSLTNTNLIIGAYGATTLALPILSCADTTLTSIINPGTGSLVTDWTIQDIAFSSSVAANFTAYGDAVRLHGTDITLRDVTFGHHVNDIFAEGTVQGILISDSSDGGNWETNYDIECIQTSHDWVVMGNSFTGASYNPGNQTGHQPWIRFESTNSTWCGRILFTDNVDEPTAANSTALTFREDDGNGNMFLYVSDNTFGNNFIVNFGYKGGNTLTYLEDWVVADSNQMYEEPFQVSNSGMHVTLRNNITHFDPSATQSIDFVGDSSAGSIVTATGYGEDDIELLNNTQYTTRTSGQAGRFLDNEGTSWRNAVIVNNLVVAPDATSTSYGDDLTVPATPATSFTRIDDNVWTDPSGAGTSNVIIVNGTAINISNWNTNYRRAINSSFSSASNDDVGATISVDSYISPIGTAADVGVPIAGVWADINGKARTATTWTVGAIDTASIIPPSNLTATPTSSTQINLVWSDNSNNESNFELDRSTSSTFATFTALTAAANATSFSDTGLTAGTTYYYRVRGTNSFGNSPYSATASATTTTTSGIFTSLDINTGVTGSTAYNATTGTYTVQGGGADIWGTSDGFRFLYEAVTGDAQIIARVVSLTAIAGSYTKGGVMIRNGTAANAQNAFMDIQYPDNTSNVADLLFRKTTGATTTYTGSGAAAITTPYWVKLVRTGNTFSGYYSPDGVTWTLSSTQTISMSSTVDIGLAYTGKSTTTLGTGIFDHVTMGRFSNISEVGATTPAAIQSNLQVGSTEYTDRTYTYNSMVSSGSTYNFTGADYIQTANSDKTVSTYSMTYTLSKTSFVYVLIWKANLPTLPTGMSGFTDTSQTLLSGGYEIFRASETAGNYTIGAEVNPNNFYMILAMGT